MTLAASCDIKLVDELMSEIMQNGDTLHSINVDKVVHLQQTLEHRRMIFSIISVKRSKRSPDLQQSTAVQTVSAAV